MSRVTSFGRMLFAAVLVGCPPSIASAQTPDRPHSDLEPGVDPSVRPGDDFFAFANGSWLRSTAIPPGKNRWTVRNEIDELTRQQIAQLVDHAGAEPVGSTARKVADFRAAWLNEDAIEGKGLAPLKPMLDSIDRVEDKAALTRFLGRGLGTDVDPLNWGVYRSSHLLGLSVEPSIHGEKTYVAFLVQGGLGLPDREYYVSTKPRMPEIRTRYHEYIGRLLSLAGFDHAEQRAESVMALETALAKTQATSEASASDHNADSLWTHADFARRAPGMDWSAFFAAAGLARQKALVPWQPAAVTGVAALVGSEPLQVWKDYLRFHLIDGYADVLPRAFAEQALAMHGAVTGQPQPSPRVQRALEATQLAMSDAIGKMYAERYFPAQQKARVEAIVANVIAAFRTRVEAAKWMSPETRALSLAKLKTLYVGMGYPNTWQDYSDLAVDAGDPVGNLRRVADRDHRRAIARLGRPVDLKEWWIAPQKVGAILIFQQNAYNFPAALLQAPKFDPAASDAANYGAIGAIVGHEVSHTVDMLGAEWDADRREHHWWTPEDSLGFEALVEPLARQISSYQPLPDLKIDSKRTQTENIADLGGLASSFDAYRGTLGSRATDKAYVRQRDREFFIGFARSWRSKIQEEALRTQLATDSHAPERYRIATVRNIDAWYDAFDVRPGQQLYLEPKERVRVW
jgi:putative endopeptidase